MESQKSIPKEFMVAELKLQYSTKMPISKCLKVTSSHQASEIFMEHWDKDLLGLQEQFKIMLLNRLNKVIGVVCISTGSVTSTIVDPKLIFGAALKAVATGIILAHNHPSSNLQPSEADKQLTQKLKCGAALLEMEILDHLIITEDSYFSFADNGIL